MDHIAVTRVAPKGEVCKAEAHVMLTIRLVVLRHVPLNVAATVHCLATRFQTDPVLATVLAETTGCVPLNTLEGRLRRDVLRRAVRAVALWYDRVEPLSVQTFDFRCHPNIWLTLT